MDKIFCENLKTARKFCNFTQKQVAEQLRVVESCYANWEQGRTEPSIEMLRKQLIQEKKKFEEILAEWVVKPQGKPVLVREDDKRPTLNIAKTDFRLEEN